MTDNLTAKTGDKNSQGYSSLILRIKKLEDELSIIHQSGFISSVPVGVRTVLADRLMQQGRRYSVYEMSEALEFSRGTYYNFIKGKSKREEKAANSERLKQIVQQTFDESRQVYGARKLHAVLKSQGIKVGEKQISEIMKELGLRSVRPDAKQMYLRMEAGRKQNLVRRQFNTDSPNRVWVSDITRFKLNKYPVYLCVIIDVFSRKVVGHKISKNSSTNLVTAVFKKAFDERKEPSELTFHSDRGCQYTSGTFCGLLKKCGVTQSFSAPGSPYDNAVAEAFFANFKKEEAYRRIYRSQNEFIRCVEEYISNYNRLRPHICEW